MEKHLPHEAWHMVQQAQGRVKSTIQMKGKVTVNHDKVLELEEANIQFTDFMQETKEINDLREKAADSIYNEYKPNPDDPEQPYTDSKDREQGELKHEFALAKAKRLNFWSTTAVESAERIYLELKAAVSVNEIRGIGTAEITMGDTEADAYPDSKTAQETKSM
jgi:hypothetical protein